MAESDREAPRSVLGSAGYYEKSMDSMDAPPAQVVNQAQETTEAQGGATGPHMNVSEQWGDFDD